MLAEVLCEKSTRLKPCCAPIALHNLLDRLASQTPDAEAGPNLIDAAHALLDAGSPLNSVSPSVRGPWSAISALARGDKSQDAGLLARIALADPDAARHADISNVWAAHHLLDSGVIEDMALFSKKIRFASLCPSRENERKPIEEILERGVKPPSLFSISFQEHRAWLDVGIFVSEKDIERKKMQEDRDSEQEIFEDWSGLDDAALVAKSNAKAHARQLRLAIDGAAASKIGGPRL
jgi:hypothetical protein